MEPENPGPSDSGHKIKKKANSCIQKYLGGEMQESVITKVKDYTKGLHLSNSNFIRLAK